MFQDFIMIFTTFLVIIGVVIFTYFTTKWMGSRMGFKSNADNIKLIDRLILSPDKSIVIAEIAGEIHSFAVSQNYILKISDINEKDIIRPYKKQSSSFENLLKTKISNVTNSIMKKGNIEQTQNTLEDEKEMDLKDEDKAI